MVYAMACKGKTKTREENEWKQQNQEKLGGL
jgi:hypothetical protein